jgi:hypothetical protein
MIIACGYIQLNYITNRILTQIILFDAAGAFQNVGRDLGTNLAEVFDDTSDRPSLRQVGVRAAAGNGFKSLLAGKPRYHCLFDICEGPDNDYLAVKQLLPRAHCRYFTVKKQVQECRLGNIVFMMAKCDFPAFQPGSGTKKYFAPVPRTPETADLPGICFLQYVRSLDMVGNFETLEIPDQGLRLPGVKTEIDMDRDQVIAYGNEFSPVSEDLKERQAVFAAGYRDRDPVAVVDQAMVDNGPACALGNIEL